MSPVPRRFNTSLLDAPCSFRWTFRVQCILFAFVFLLGGQLEGREPGKLNREQRSSEEKSSERILETTDLSFGAAAFIKGGSDSGTPVTSYTVRKILPISFTRKWITSPKPLFLDLPIDPRSTWKSDPSPPYLGSFL